MNHEFRAHGGDACAQIEQLEAAQESLSLKLERLSSERDAMMAQLEQHLHDKGEISAHAAEQARRLEQSLSHVCLHSLFALPPHALAGQVCGRNTESHPCRLLELFDCRLFEAIF